MEKQYCEIHSFLDGEENCPDCNPSRVELPVKVNFADFKLAISLLRDLADLQNGSPLVTCEKEWQRTMDNIYVFLNEHESKISAQAVKNENENNIFINKLL